jgi:predicted  nucleic acid-binding Zn-ribbon protein
VQDVAERSREKSNMLQGFGDAVLRAEALEEQLLKSRKHAAAMQSKLDAAFAKYHKDVQELQAKGDDLVRKIRVFATITKVRRWTCRVVVGGREVV